MLPQYLLSMFTLEAKMVGMVWLIEHRLFYLFSWCYLTSKNEDLQFFVCNLHWPKFLA
jgi:hypothetical protein